MYKFNKFYHVELDLPMTIGNGIAHNPTLGLQEQGQIQIIIINVDENNVYTI